MSKKMRVEGRGSREDETREEEDVKRTRETEEEREREVGVLGVEN